MYKWDISLPSDIRQRRRAIAVDAEGSSHLGFRLIHSRIGSSIDDHAGGDRGDHPVDPLTDFQVEVLASEGDHGQAATSGEITKTAGQLAISTSNQYRSFDHG